MHTGATGRECLDDLRLEEENMDKRELAARELAQIADKDLDTVLAFIRALIAEAHSDAAFPRLVSESALAKDWLSPEEDAAWANL